MQTKLVTLSRIVLLAMMEVGCSGMVLPVHDRDPMSTNSMLKDASIPSAEASDGDA